MNCPSCGDAMEKRGAPSNAGFWTYNHETWNCFACRLSFAAGRPARVQHVGWPQAPYRDMSLEPGYTDEKGSGLGRHGITYKPKDYKR